MSSGMSGYWIVAHLGGEGREYVALDDTPDTEEGARKAWDEYVTPEGRTMLGGIILPPGVKLHGKGQIRLGPPKGS